MVNAETFAGIPSGGPDLAGAVSDRLLWARYVEHGDESAFADLVYRHGRTVWGVCRRLLRQEQDVEDAFQAVFLVLARKIASIRKGEAVGSWLYGVAYRTAMKIRSNAARRQVLERQATGPTGQVPSPPSEAACRELQRMLDEEVERLAPKYRAPFVLCCLEGLSRPEAAAELGGKEGTVCSRLAQARKLLQTRLGKRGITLSAVLTAGALSQSTAAAATPAILGPSTVKVVLASASAGDAVTTAVSPTALALADSVARSLTSIKLKMTLWLGMVLTLASGIISLAAIQDKTAPVSTPPKKVPMAQAAELEPQPKVPGNQPGGGILWAGGVAFSHDAKRLVNSITRTDQPGHLRVWDWSLINELLNLTNIPLTTVAALSPDGETLASADFNGDIRLREVRTGREKLVVKSPAKIVDGLTFSPDGFGLLAGDAAGGLTLWDLKAPGTPRQFRGHQGGISEVAFLHRRSAILSASQDGTVRIWDMDTGKEQLVLRAHEGGVIALAVAADDRLAATLGQDQTMRVWDLEIGQQTAILKGKDAEISALAFSPDGTQLAIAAKDGMIRLWDVKKEVVVKDLVPQVRAMHALAFTPDGKHLAAGCRSLPGFVMLDVAGDDSVKTSRYREYYSSLRGGAKSLRDMELRGRQPDENVHFEPDGLRISLPAGQPATAQGIGVSPRLDVGGDFEITVNYEILHEPEPADNNTNTRFSLMVVLNRRPQQRNMAYVSRRVAKEGRQFDLWHILQDEANPDSVKKRALFVPASASTGRLRLTRTGALLGYYVADGANGPFRLFRQIPFVNEDLKEVRIMASTGGPKASLDVRFTDLRIRAESLPNLPSTSSDVADAGRSEVAPGLPTVSVGETKSWRPAAAVFFLGLAACLWICLLVLARRRRSRQAVRVIANDKKAPRTITAEPKLVCNCTGCGKKLRGSTKLAGKMVKCPQCGVGVRLPRE
jgi:RNA polymerase sigma factor (sigma-70 family)